MDLQTCMFTNTPDHHFVIDLHPAYPQVSIASPCSGHGFKFASVVGEIMADLAEKGFTRHDISLFRLSRLSQPTSHQPVSGGQPAQQTDGRARSFDRMGDIKTFW
jgi:sarcosine oxidase